MSVRSEWGRRLTLSAAGLLVASCGFPEFTFVEDGQFYGTGGVAGVGATGGSSVGATGGIAGAGATGGTGVGATGGTGVGATGGTGVGATGGGGTGGTGGGGGPENCTNGVDDDGDGKIDCEDTDCQAGFTCAPSLPTGWVGPVAMFEGAAPAPDCLQSGGYPTIKQNANSTIKAGAATCPTCACDPATGAQCTADLFMYDDTACQGNFWTTSTSPPYAPTALVSSSGQCVTYSLCHGADDAGTYKPTSVNFKNLQVSGGTCSPKTTGTKNIVAPTWDKAVRACGDASGAGKGCGTTGACLPKPKAPFGTGLCVYKTGDVACPSGAYSQKKLSYLNFTDNRDCDACACGSASSGTCSNPSLKIYTDACVTNEQTVTANACVLASNDPTTQSGGCAGFPADTRGAKLTATVSGATCPASGGQVTGSAAPTEPVTFCCL
ncbi:MAG: hypothetical protein IPI67_14930 [Myxococcales bacterium]|nr:hypothetical protein [Myxococcales bacterium]